MIRDFIDRLEQEAAAEASPQGVLCAVAQLVVVVSDDLCAFSYCLTCTIRHGATESCTRTRTKETQRLSKLRNSQLKWRSRKLTSQT